jgi:hypothetical protein
MREPAAVLWPWGTIVAVLLVNPGCRSAPAPGPPPVSPHDSGEAPPPPGPSGAPTGGVVDDVPWTLVHHEGDPDRLVLGSGAGAVTVALKTNAQGCYVSDRLTGSWCHIEEMARALVKFDPDLARLRTGK